MLKQRSLVILILVFHMSCNSNHQNQESSPITYLALGDSYTIGESVLEAQRWPNQLVESLKGKGIEITDAEILAKTGWTTDELMQAIKDSVLDETYDFVSLLIGVNNQYRGRSAENFREEFSDLLNIAINFAAKNPAKVFVLSIPDWGLTPFAKNRDVSKIAEEIDLFNKIAKEECEKQKILFIDITDISRLVLQDAALLADDGLHPSGKLYGQWVDRIIQHVTALIQK